MLFLHFTSYGNTIQAHILEAKTCIRGCGKVWLAVRDERRERRDDGSPATKSYSGNPSSGTLSDGTHFVSRLLLGNYKAMSLSLG
ncbi:MAG TPA: hypothetical protein VN823_22450, partial [Stellaceae bacterium]|nr:hypothetical protein [Stellaceae bacterium]